jgi:hypothetical protein
MTEIDIERSKAAMALIQSLAGHLPLTAEVTEALGVLHGSVLELEAWKKLKDPVILHGNLLAGMPAKLSAASLLHLAGAGLCSNQGACLAKTDDVRPG